ncbi:hypothetical protein BDZ45DRAFT_741857 [Acephala macrosclerotiorum]|nr:hypothetical protein BDZ45DRAFT_741857 [Acephala macrosclerotiorum]
MPDLQISRVSSEAPEVVPGQFLYAIEPTHLTTPSPSTSQASTQLPGLHSRSHSWLSDRKSRHVQDGGAGVTTPQVINDDAAPYQPKVHTGRVFSLVATIILVVIAFCIGGGIGGGITGAVMSSPVSTSQSTVYVDQAGCPLINNSTYTSTAGATFLTICATAILSSTSTQNIDLSNSTQSSFNACLDACANAAGCVGASWYMFDPTTPSRNSICFLKSGTGEEVMANGGNYSPSCHCVASASPSSKLSPTPIALSAVAGILVLALLILLLQSFTATLPSEFQHQPEPKQTFEAYTDRVVAELGCTEAPYTPQSGSALAVRREEV